MRKPDLELTFACGYVGLAGGTVDAEIMRVPSPRMRALAECKPGCQPGALDETACIDDRA